jgi:hypothetical protein
MKTKDLVYIGIIGYLAYLILRKKPKVASTSLPESTVGNGSNGGLNLNSNMDLPNLTPTPKNGLSTENALGNSNITPLNKNEPTQIFGEISLPLPAGSLINTNTSIPKSINNFNPASQSVISEPLPLFTPTKSIDNILNTELSVEEQIISGCKTRFSIPNNDKEGSNVDYWFDGKAFFSQKISPLIKTIPTQITQEVFTEACRKFNSF